MKELVTRKLEEAQAALNRAEEQVAQLCLDLVGCNERTLHHTAQDRIKKVTRDCIEAETRIELCQELLKELE